ncbi:MAG: hypothetical protein ACFFCZ_29250 [Promethearchaeota archaeon]
MTHKGKSSWLNLISDRQKILLLRTSYWLGAILDALMAIDLTIVTVFGFGSVLSPFFTSLEFANNSNINYQFAMGIGAALMWGWTFLLIWADRNPLERRGVALLTAFPVVLFMMINYWIAGIFDKWPAQIALILLFVISYWITRNIELNKQ